MLVVFVKSLVLLVIIVVMLRLMGKRQIAEMQPFELVITLIIAEVACIPMNDPYIPLYCGIIPIVTLGVVEIILSFLARKSFIVRQALGGSPIIVIDKDGINYNHLKKMNINIDDLIESACTSGCTDLSKIAYAIYETSGKLVVIEKPNQGEGGTAFLPVAVVVDGKWKPCAMGKVGITQQEVEQLIAKQGFKVGDIALIDVRQDGTVFVAPKNKRSYLAQASIRGEW